MRNLVALQRRVWALEKANSTSDKCVSFATIPGESQVFFLRDSGRIDVLQPIEDDSSQELRLFLDLNEFLDTEEIARGHWRWMNYAAELGTLVCASTSGALVSVDVDAMDGEEVGAVDTGLRAVAWSGNQEMLALVTGAGRLLVMSNDWEVLHETDIEESLTGNLVLYGDKERWECELCWREDSQFLAVNISTIEKKEGGQVGDIVQKVLVFTAQLEVHAVGRLEDDRAIPGLDSTLHWSQSMALIVSSETRKSRRLFVVFFERNGLRHGEFEIPAPYRAPTYRVSDVQWNATSDILAVSLKPIGTAVVDEKEIKPQSIVQLWTRNNYHWYLKQELRLPSQDQLVSFTWDEEVAGRLDILSRSSVSQELTFYEHEFAWDICSVEAELPLKGHDLARDEDQKQLQSIAVTGVIDGCRILLTPLHRAMVPPPFALLQASFDSAINSAVFDSQSETLLVLLATGVVVLVENYLSPRNDRDSAAGLPPASTKRAANPELAMSMTTVYVPADTKPITLETLLWARFSTESRQLDFVGKSGDQDQLTVCSADVASASEDVVVAIVLEASLHHVRRLCEAFSPQIKDNGTIASNKSSRVFAVQTQDGAVYTIRDLERSTPVQVPGKFPAFSHLAVLNHGRRDKQEGDGITVIGLDVSSARLLANGELLASACSSFRYCALSSVLLFTTQGREPQLRIAPLAALRNFTKGAAMDSVPFESRSIERGALLVATVGQRANVIVQMPRGNLECISPRLLVLALVEQQIKAREYVVALEICRRHRLDLNVLVDFDPQEFLDNFSACLVKHFLSSRPAAVTSDRLCLFITNLHPVNVWATKYGPLLAPFKAGEVQANDADFQDNEEAATAQGLEDKVNKVCQAFMKAIQEYETNGDAAAAALLLPYVTSAVKQSPARFDEALGKIHSLLHRGEKDDDDDSFNQRRASATRAIKHLIMLTDVDSLYSEALGLYDLDLVRAVATHSQRDPKEYVPFLDHVAQFENENWRKYTIDEHLGRHSKALEHLSALMNDARDDNGNAEEMNKLQALALELIKQGELYDEGTRLFPFAAAKRSLSESERTFRRQILLLKGDFLESVKKYEAAAYVYLSALDQEKARRSFLSANKWQMALALSARKLESPEKLRNEAYTVAQELLNRHQQQQSGSIDDILAAARIYVEYCDDIDEAVGLLVTHQQWTEALRVAYLHKREDLVESDVEAGVLQNCDDILEELERNQKAYIKHWSRLTTILEQKRLFKLHGIDGSRWEHGTDADAVSVRSGASSAADSALSNISMSSVGSHNSAASIGNFSMQSLSAATASHFYATQALGEGGKKPKSSTKHGGMPSRRERRKRMKEGSAEEEAYVAQQLKELRPSAALARDVGALLEMLIFFGHAQQGQSLQTQLADFEQCVAAKPIPSLEDDTRLGSEKQVQDSQDQDYPPWRLDALQG